MTDPTHYTDPAWAAREARRIALEEAEEAIRKLHHRGPPGSVYLTVAIDDALRAIRALLNREAGE